MAIFKKSEKPKKKEKEVKEPEAPVEVDLGWIKGVHYFD